MQRVQGIGQGIGPWIAMAVALSAATARAGNDDELLVGNEAAMVGGAVTASVQEASALYYNPAGLAGVEDTRLDISASAYTLRRYTVPRFLGVAGGPTRDATVDEWLVVPTVFALARELAEGVVLGLGWFMPRDTAYLLREHLTVDDGGTSSQWALDLMVEENEQRFAAGIGVRLAPHVRVGTGLFATAGSRTESSTIFGAVSGPDGPIRTLQLSALGTRSTIGSELSLGLQVDVTPALTVGLSAQSPRLQLWRSTDESLVETFASLSPDAPPLLVASAEDPKRSGWTAALTRMGRYRAGVAYNLARLQLLLDVDLQPGVSNTEANATRRLVWNARAGARYRVDDGVVIGAGGFTDRSADRMDDGAVSGAPNFYGGTLGLELTDLYGLLVARAQRTLALQTTLSLRYAYGSGRTGVLVVDPADDAAPFRIGNGRGRAHELGFQVGSGLRF